MKEHQQQLVELQIGAIANGHLCTAVYPSVFEALLTKLPQIRSREQVRVNLDKLEWIDHLPLLSLTLALRQCARLHPNGCEVVMPAIPEREAFLERWGFFKLLDELQLGYEITENPNPYKESQHSRV